MQQFNSTDSISECYRRSGNRLGIKNFDKWKKDILYNWVRDNDDNPYPSESAKDKLATQCKMTKKQVINNLSLLKL